MTTFNRMVNSPVAEYCIVIPAQAGIQEAWMPDKTLGHDSI